MKSSTACLLASLLLAAPGVAAAADSLQSLNMNPDAAHRAVLETFDRGFVTLPAGYVAFWALDDAHRAALVPPLLSIVRAYVESPDFAAKLLAARQAGVSEAARAAQSSRSALAEQVVADRLRQFLDLSADVDFNARMVTRKGQTCFADARLESRPPEWKLCYRAGPQTLAAARAFAGDWLKTLGARAER